MTAFLVALGIVLFVVVWVWALIVHLTSKRYTRWYDVPPPRRRTKG